MTTPRTIKASEVVKGMRVRVEESLGSRTTQVTEGLVMADATPYHAEYFDLELDGATIIGIAGDHPVTVLAEPDPEWVEGAWYWTQTHDPRPGARQRVSGGWAERGVDGGDIAWSDYGDNVTVLGRVLIVDWPGDDVAREIERTYTPGGKWIATESTAAQIIADAIRTQGGVR